MSAFLMVLLGLRKAKLMKFVRKYGLAMAAPIAAGHEAALAGILIVRFGGLMMILVRRSINPYISTNNRKLTTADMVRSITVFHRAEVMAVAMGMCSPGFCSCSFLYNSPNLKIEHFSQQASFKAKKRLSARFLIRVTIRVSHRTPAVGRKPLT